MSLESIHERLNKDAVAIQLPIGEEGGFMGVIDLLTRQAYNFEGKMGETVVKVDMPADMTDKVEEYRSKLIERISETDDALMEKYLSDEEPTLSELKAALRKATIAFELIPVLCGTALQNKGAQLLLDAVCDYLPSPMDLPAVKGIKPHSEEEDSRELKESAPFSALAFKIATDPYIGKLCFLRVYSGSLTSGSYVYNSSTDKKERIGRLVQMHSNSREEIKEVKAGDIVAAVGLKQTTTGNTLCDDNKPIILESMDFPEPVIDIAIEPKTKADQEKMGIALQKLAEEDPTFRVHTDDETGQTIIGGMGELHLDIIVDRMRREFKVEANVGQPQVAYRETIQKEVQAEEKYSKQTGGRGQYGHVLMKISPNEPGKGFEFINSIVGGKIPKEFINPVQKGVEQAMTRGIVAGYQVVDVKVELYDGSYHDVDSSEMSFKTAGSICFRDGARTANPVILEPIMKVEAITPEDYMGDVMGDLNSRRGQIQEMGDRGQAKFIRAMVPLSEMFGYATDLRSMTQGRASYSMEFAQYEKAPKNVIEKIKAEKGITS